MALPSQQFCVRWNSYHANLQVIFPRLLCTQQFADVTLACESEMVRCHKVVLSACSTYFEKLLTNNPCKHPIIFMKDMRFSEVQQLVEFMYRGEVNVTQEELPSLLRAAEALHIRGLCGPETNGNHPPPRDEPPQQCTPISNPIVETLKQYPNTSTGDALLSSRTHTSTDTQTSSFSLKANNEDQSDSDFPCKKTKLDNSSESQEDIKDDKEVILEDGVYYGEMDHDDTSNDKDESGECSSGVDRGIALDSQTSSGYVRVKPLHTLFKNNSRASEMSQTTFKKFPPKDAKDQESFFIDSENYIRSWMENNEELEISVAGEDTEDQISKRKDKFDNVTIYYGNVKLNSFPGDPHQEEIFKDGQDLQESHGSEDMDGICDLSMLREDLNGAPKNRPRSYSDHAMFAALMDVKRGGSIYKAAQTHNVPRKSLRNWMKKWHIKSSFPMPEQLKQFVENNRKQKEIYKKALLKAAEEKEFNLSFNDSSREKLLSEIDLR